MKDFPKVGSFRHLMWMIKENMYEYESNDVINSKTGFQCYHRYNFAFRMFISWLLRLKCVYCDEDGMQGYYEREACYTCDGFGLQWNSLIKQKWINFWKEKGHEDRSYFEFQKYYSKE